MIEFNEKFILPLIIKKIGNKSQKESFDIIDEAFLQIYSHIESVDIIEVKGMILSYKNGLLNPNQSNSRKIFEYILQKMQILKELLDEVEEYDNKDLQAKKRGIKVDLKKPPARYYALYHAILISLGQKIGLRKNDDDRYIKSEIEGIAREYGVSERTFYNEIRSLDLNKKLSIAQSFGAGYKDKIAFISGNSSVVIQELRKYPD